VERHARREQVLACAVRVFSRRGYHATTVSDIIDEAGVARGTFYLYFKSKRAIFDELLDDFLKRILGEIRRVDLSPGAAPPLEQMRDIVDRVLGVLLGSLEMARILLRAAVGLDADFDRKLEEFRKKLVERIEGSLRLGQGMGLVTDCDVRVASLCVLGSVKEVVDAMLTDPAVLPEPAVLADEILKVLLGGLFVQSARQGERRERSEGR
jgi:AcrR family transcriptional regulator